MKVKIGVQNMAPLYLELAGYINIILEKGILRIQFLLTVNSK